MSDPRPVPYPADTRAKGWRFELDMERFKESDTWLKARTMQVRALLLLLWAESWQQKPCGTLPNDDEMISTLLGMEPEEFAQRRAVLMRGWWMGEDGRFYHDVMVERVLAMLAKREKDAKRIAVKRASRGESQESRGDTDATSKRVAGESDTKHQAPTTSAKAEVPRKRRAPAALPPDCPGDVDPGVWRDWLALRKAKSAPVTPTVVESARSEAGIAGLTLEAFLRVWCARGSQGLQADWLKAHELPARSPPKTFHERETAAKAARAAEMTGGLVGSRTRTLDEVFDVPAITSG